MMQYEIFHGAAWLHIAIVYADSCNSTHTLGVYI